ADKATVQTPTKVGTLNTGHPSRHLPSERLTTNHELSRCQIFTAPIRFRVGRPLPHNLIQSNSLLPPEQFWHCCCCIEGGLVASEETKEIKVEVVDLCTTRKKKRGR